MSRTTTRRAPVALFDHLEPRLVFSAPFDFTAVGIRFDDGPRAFITDGVIAEDNTITGSTRFADAAGAQTSGPIDWTSYTRGDDGAFTFGTRDGFTPYASQFGTQFLYEAFSISTRGFAARWRASRRPELNLGRSADIETGTAWHAGLSRDFRHAWRTLVRRPGTSVVIVATLALALATNATSFAIMDAIVLRPYRFPDVDRIVMIASTDARSL